MNHFSLIYICSEYPSFIYIVLLLWRGGTYVGRQQHSGKMLTLNVNDEITFFAFLKDWKTVTEKFAILFFFFVFFFLLEYCTACYPAAQHEIAHVVPNYIQVITLFIFFAFIAEFLRVALMFLAFI